MLTANEVQRAAAQGWQVCEVFDLQTNKLGPQILPTDFAAMSSHQALSLVMGLAKGHDDLAIKALTLIARSKLYKRKGRK